MLDNQNELHVGHIVKAYIDKRRISKAALCRKIGMQDRNFLRVQATPAVKTSLLLEISHALKHNFFGDIAGMLPDAYSTSVVPDNTNAERIAALEKEVEMLKAEKAVLMQAIRMRTGVE